MINSLSGRFLILTVIFVMLAEILIFVPSVSRFRLDYLQERLERSQLASLALLATPDDMVDPDLEVELLENAGVLNIVLRRSSVRELVLAEPVPMPGEVEETFDLRRATTWDLIRDALVCLIRAEPRLIRVIGKPVHGAGLSIEVTLKEEPLKMAMRDYGGRILALSALISVITAAMLFFAVRRVIVRPIRGVIDSMVAYQQNPEDARRIIAPTAGVNEVREAETALQDLQGQLTRHLRQNERLAALGAGVAKITHDLRNMLTTVQLLADRMEMSEDPAVKRTAPKLIGSVDRAITLAEQTLTFGKADEAAPKMAPVDLRALVDDIIDSEKLRAGTEDVELVSDIPADLIITADAEQIFRAVNNLVRNARQVLIDTGAPGTISVSAKTDGDAVLIDVDDTGPGVPEKALPSLFKPFQASSKRGGTGLGLAIAAELVRGHGGTIDLARNDASGACFRIRLPQSPSSGK